MHRCPSDARRLHTFRMVVYPFADPASLVFPSIVMQRKCSTIWPRSSPRFHTAVGTTLMSASDTKGVKGSRERKRMMILSRRQMLGRRRATGPDSHPGAA